MVGVSTLLAYAEGIEVATLKYAGPFVFSPPAMVDSVDVNGQKYDDDSILKSSLSFDCLAKGVVITDSMMPSANRSALHLVGFDVESTRMAKVNIKVTTDLPHKVFVDNDEIDGDTSLQPGTHHVVVKYATSSADKMPMHITIDDEGKNIISIVSGNKRMYTIYDVITAKRLNAVSLSPNGKYLIESCTSIQREGTKVQTYRILNASNGNCILETHEHIRWMPRSNRYYFFVDDSDDSQHIVTVDPVTNDRSILVSGLDSEIDYVISPDERFLIGHDTDNGKSKDSEVYEIRTPEDRQPGYRDRLFPIKVDIATGLTERLVFSGNDVHSIDISSDGSKLLLMLSRERLESRPTTVYDLYVMDINSRKMEKLVDSDGFITWACFSPDASKVLIQGSPESLGGIGKNVGEGQVPSMIDMQLYLIDVASRKSTPLTLNFNPNVESLYWSHFDGMVYFTAENKDMISLYRLNPKDGKINMLDSCEDVVTDIDVANNAPVIAWIGQSASNSDRLYSLVTKTSKVNKPILLDDPSKETLKDVVLGECREWNYVNANGDTIFGRYYLPPDFDASRQYPMIVNYYGGCSPTSRYFESRYPHHAYAALGYVIYVLQPSGSTGFGQRFSARHVNSAGEGPAQDIIEGVKRFCEVHSFVNSKKIGCIGASYGGFMTQYLQTKTDIFAAAVSHAGISDHTSYWGQGYWGYSYSEVSMANNYPWSNKELYVERSPLYNAEKIHTPLLFVHGTGDVNVPLGESIQMFTALKLLGRETALVAVEGEDHHILSYSKRIKWQNTIYAWFAKWLQDDPSWWNEMYK